MSFGFSRDLRIDGKLRAELSKPFGKIIKTTPQLGMKIGKDSRIYAIGDVTVAGVLELGFRPKLAIFDYRTGRKRHSFQIIKRTYRRPMQVRNRSGTLSVSLWKAVKNASAASSSRSIRVIGEEDLASLACIYFARKGDLVIYGLRKKGMAVITVNGRIKSYVAKVLERMNQ